MSACSAVTYTLPGTRRFDFNTASSPTQSPAASPTTPTGYLSVQPEDPYSTVRGYGWDTPLTSGSGAQGAIDRGDLPGSQAQEELRRDGHFSSNAHTFSVAVDNGTYWVSLTLGDAQAMRDHVRVQAEGTVVPALSVNVDLPSAISCLPPDSAAYSG